MKLKKGKSRSARVALAITTAAVILMILLNELTDIGNVVSQQLMNVLVSSAVLINGLAVLQLIWKLEFHDARGSLPFAWCYFTLQHLAFGFGGFLVSITNQDYTYQNAFGNFSWNDVVVPLLLVHFVCMNAGLIGVWAGTRGSRLARLPAKPIWQADRWPWELIGPICLMSLFLHGVVWLLLIDRKLGVITYITQALSYCTNATFILWGLMWKQSPNKRIFIIYLSILTAIEMIRGNRTFFAFPIILFGIGLFISYSGSRGKIKAIAISLPFAIVLFWGFVKSEDIRQLFSRGASSSTEEATARAETLTGPDSYVAIDALGNPMNSAFRIGARLFELSAADVISRTPSVISFWGWTDEDWSILRTGFLPLKLNTDAAANTSDNAGDGFLQEYGWVIDHEEGGTSMPATLVGDSWRRFGWPGVIGMFLVWSWFLAKVTTLVRLVKVNANMALFSAGILANITFFYTTDLTTLVTSIPRRLIVVYIYSVITVGLSKLIERRQYSASERYSASVPV